MGGIFALCIDPFLRRLLIRSLVGLVRLASSADALASMLDNIGPVWPVVAEGFAGGRGGDGAAPVAWPQGPSVQLLYNCGASQTWRWRSCFGRRALGSQDARSARVRSTW